MHPQLRWTTRLGVILDRDAYIEGNTNGSLVWRAQRLEEPEVTVAGKVAILNAVVIDEVEVEGQAQTFCLRLTQTWVHEEGQWRCISGHASPSA
jgi:ketosteroid isomerase-like protein